MESNAAARSASISQESSTAGLGNAAARIESAVESVVLGHAGEIRIIVSALLAGHHVLLVDEPGVGKTTLASAIAHAIGGRFSRIQGTPDLLPTDMTGSMVYSQKSSEWEFHPGSLMADVVLVDEINRISPRSQSALLEAMAEGHVSIDGEVRPLPFPYFVIATMNPRGSAGTFNLTPGQADRFGVSLALGQVEREIEMSLIQRPPGLTLADRITSVIESGQLATLQHTVGEVFVSESVVCYIIQLCEAVRTDTHVSMRASRSILEIARGLAYLDGDHFVTPDHVKRVVPGCLAHRLGEIGGADEVSGFLGLLLERIPPPTSTRL